MRAERRQNQKSAAVIRDWLFAGLMPPMPNPTKIAIRKIETILDDPNNKPLLPRNIRQILIDKDRTEAEISATIQRLETYKRLYNLIYNVRFRSP